MNNVDIKKLSSHQINLILYVLYRSQFYCENGKHTSDYYEINFVGLDFKVWGKDLEEINAIINCIVEAL